ncbi:hypothetical protein [Corynebacterium auris]|uniref:hypothetical protein n=1 Tax=Corynebacterium auris TaxID=44750 RepID=UPI0025B411BC|nr:hypothetical protein [Corynebacterium auris]WJY68045.1 hypothetical protein CAURIS_05710 [Corynebacterium auris]
MPIRSVLRSMPWVTLLVLLGTCMLGVRALRVISFHVGRDPFDPFVVTAPEIASLIFAVCAAALAAPTMPEVDLRRPRSQWLAVARHAGAALCVVAVASFADHQVKAGFVVLAETTQGGVPESELIINNSLLLFAIAGLAITALGKLRGVVVSLAVWLAANSALLFFSGFTPWPFAVLAEAGPWFSWPHVAATLLVLAADAAVQHRTAGASGRALRADR